MRGWRHFPVAAGSGGGGGGAYTARSVSFDGSTTYLARNGDLNGNAIGQRGIVSVWFLARSWSGVDPTLYANTSRRLALQYKTGNALVQLLGNNAAGATVLNLRTDGSPVRNAWNHLIISWDLSSAGAHWVYLNDVAQDNVPAFAVGESIEYTRDQHTVGAHTDGSQPLDGLLADIYLDTATALDLSVVSNRRKFRDAAGKPVDLGADGSLPTGAAAILYLSRRNGAGDFVGNKGTGGGMTLHGTLSEGSSDP